MIYDILDREGNLDGVPITVDGMEIKQVVMVYGEESAVEDYDIKRIELRLESE